MSKSDSDDLEFESADEDQKNDLSDLDIDEILNEDDDDKQATVAQSKSNKSLEKQQTRIEKSVVSDDKKEPVEELKKLTLKEAESASPTKIEPKTDTKKDDVVALTKSKNAETTASKAAESGWNDTNLSDIKDNDDTSKNSKDVKSGSQKTEKEEEEKSKKQVEKKNQSDWDAGWDDSRFSDIDEDENNENINKQDLKSGERKLVEEKRSITEQRAPKNEEPKPVMEQKAQQPFQPQQQQPQSQSLIGGSGWGWASKLGSNLLSSAASLTTQMLETVEASLGAPDPTELAAKVAAAKTSEEEDQKKEVETKQNETSATKQTGEATTETADSWKFDNSDAGEWFSINKIATTGTNLVSGSLDVLETVGKKTFELINDKDPNFKQTKELFKKVPIATKPNLSQLLREAQSQHNSDSAVASSNVSTSATKTPSVVERATKQEKFTFSLFFDEFKGTVHLEALEMLSSQATMKLEVVGGTPRPATKTDLERLEHLFDTNELMGEDEDEDADEDDDEDEDSIKNDLKSLVDDKDNMFDVARFEKLLAQYSRDARIKMNIDKIVAAYRTASFATREVLSSIEMYNESIKCFALITSNMIELFHKAAETIYVELDDSKGKVKRDDVFKNAEAIFRITKLSIKGVSILSNDYSKRCKINARQLNEGNPSRIITDIYLEASNSNTFIGDAYALFLPMFKYLLLKETSSSY